MDRAFLEQAVPEMLATLPWSQHLIILNKTTDPAARLYCLRATAQFGWSRAVLPNQWLTAQLALPELDAAPERGQPCPRESSPISSFRADKAVRTPIASR